MPLIRMVQPYLNVAGATRERGEVVDVEEGTAALLCTGGHAVRLDGVPERVPSGVETTSTRASARPTRRPKEQW